VRNTGTEGEEHSSGTVLYDTPPGSDSWFELSMTLPQRLGYAGALTKLKWKLSGSPVTLRVKLKLDTGLAQWKSMHVPVASNAESDVRDLVTAFGLQNKLVNPTHLADAQLLVQGSVTTVEKQWIVAQTEKVLTQQ